MANEDDGMLPAEVVQHVTAVDVGIAGDDAEFASHRAKFEEDMRVIYVDSNEQAHIVDIAYGEKGSSRFSEDVPDAEAVHATGSSGGGMQPPQDPGASGGPGFGDFIRNDELGDEAVESYLEAVETWRSGPTVANQADVLEDLKRSRLSATRTLADTGYLSDPRLKDVEEYLKADLHYLDRPDKADEDYASFVRRQTRLREKVFGDEVIIDAGSYALAAQKFQNRIVSEKSVLMQYDLLSVRREAALEHFDDPRFIAEIGLHEADLGDELLVDFDRRDLLDEQHSHRSEALSQTFTEAVTQARGASSSMDKVRSFAELRAVGQAIRHDQMAIINFAKSSKEDRALHETGLSALDNVTFSEDVGKKWFDGLSEEDQAALRANNNPVAFFKVARDSFERDLAAGDPRAALGFAMLEESGKFILKDEKLRRRLRDEGSLSDQQAIEVFEQKFQDRNLSKVAEAVEDTVMAKLEQAGNLRAKEDARGTGLAVEIDKDTGEEAYKLDLSKNAKTAKITVVDGSHVLLSKDEADAKEGKGVVMRLDGITTPPEGVQTKSGYLDAGQMAREHLRIVLAQHEHQGLALDALTNEKGEQVLSVKLSSGENLSQRMIRDGYAMPTTDSAGKIRREHLANQAEAQRRGLWREGFPEMDESWRSERAGPTLSASDKKDRVCETVGSALAGSKDDAYRRLLRRDTKLFALPVEEWSADYRIDEEVNRVVQSNPGRVREIYGHNMEILKDLRKRKDKLTDDEKLAHDRLSLGRRAMAKSLVKFGHMTEEEAMKDGHPLMSRKARRSNIEALRPIREGAMKAAEATAEGAKFVGSKTRKSLTSIIDTAME